MIHTRAWKVDPPGEDPYNTNLGIYKGHPAAWDFPKPKNGNLVFVDEQKKQGYWEAQYTYRWFLFLTSAAHYFTYVTQLAVALAYYGAAGSPSVALDHHQVVSAVPFLLVAGPLFQAMGGAGPNVMHEYEGFQVVPFSGYPLPDDDKNSKDGSRSDYNNDALRQVAYRSLFQLQAVGAAMFAAGALWPAEWPTNFIWPLLALLGLACYLSPRHVWYPRLPIGKVELLLPPLPVGPLLLFAATASLQWFGLMRIFGAPLGTGITVLLIAGGLLEAGLAEGTYDQRWHLLAVVMLNLGGWMQVAALNQWWGSTTFQVAMTGVVLGVGALLVGAVPDMYRKVTNDPPQKKKNCCGWLIGNGR